MPPARRRAPRWPTSRSGTRRARRCPPPCATDSTSARPTARCRSVSGCRRSCPASPRPSRPARRRWTGEPARPGQRGDRRRRDAAGAVRARRGAARARRLGGAAGRADRRPGVGAGRGRPPTAGASDRPGPRCRPRRRSVGHGRRAGAARAAGHRADAHGPAAVSRERGQVAPLAVALALLLVAGGAVLMHLARVGDAGGRGQTAADLAAISAARVLASDPFADEASLRAAAERTAAANGARVTAVTLLADGGLPTGVEVTVDAVATGDVPGAGRR